MDTNCLFVEDNFGTIEDNNILIDTRHDVTGLLSVVAFGLCSICTLRDQCEPEVLVEADKQRIKIIRNLEV